MFHVKQLSEVFLRCASDWNRKHRIVGGKDLSELFSESQQAVGDFLNANPYKNYLDVGAGSGLLGLAILEHPGLRVMFIEPAKKKAGFLSYLRSELSPDLQERFFVEASRVQDVSRETLSKKGFSEDAAVISRAFSSDSSLSSALEKSELTVCPAFIFEIDQKSKKPRLRPL